MRAKLIYKTAKKIAAAFDLFCPECQEPVPAPGGSLFWTREEIELQGNEPGTCLACLNKFKLPKVSNSKGTNPAPALHASTSSNSRRRSSITWLRRRKFSIWKT